MYEQASPGLSYWYWNIRMSISERERFMMQARVIDKPHMIVKRDAFLDRAYELFSTETIDSVSMQDVADASGYGVATLYRYFRTKPALVVAVATWQWEKFIEEKTHSFTPDVRESMTAGKRYEMYLDSFVELYKEHKDLLRFNQFFNIYIQSENVDQEGLQSYRSIIDVVRKGFHEVYQKAKEDHTLRTDIPEEEIFSTTLHMMLAAVTRYAVGLVYIPKKGFDPIREIETLKEMFKDWYTC